MRRILAVVSALFALVGVGCAAAEHVDVAGSENQAELDVCAKPRATETVQIDVSGPFSTPPKPEWLDDRSYCALISTGRSSPSGNRLEVATPTGPGYVNHMQGSIYSWSLVPVLDGRSGALLGYFQPKVGFVDPSARDRGGRAAFEAAGVQTVLDEILATCRSPEPSPSPDATLVCDSVTRRLVESGASPGVGDFIDPVG